ncbi:MAG: hypothetical protein AAGF19_10230, partial [Pseudomonadota bacterium]
RAGGVGGGPVDRDWRPLALDKTVVRQGLAGATALMFCGGENPATRRARARASITGTRGRPPLLLQ